MSDPSARLIDEAQSAAEDRQVRSVCSKTYPYVILWKTRLGAVDSLTALWTAWERDMFTDALDNDGAQWILRRDGEKGYEWAYSTTNQKERAILHLLIEGYLNPRRCRCSEQAVIDDPEAREEAKRRHPSFQGRSLS